MSPDQAKTLLESSIAVTNQMVMYAKAFILKNFNTDTCRLLDALLKNIEASVPERIVIHSSVDTETMVRQAAKAISWRLAGCEAIWGLISNGLLIPGSSSLTEECRSLSWTTVIPGSGGTSSGWQLDHLSLPVPGRILKPFSSVAEINQPLSDPDMYLHELAIENLDKDVEESLRESVRWFKHDLEFGLLSAPWESVRRGMD